jgi:hypothetical protein
MWLVNGKEVKKRTALLTRKEYYSETLTRSASESPRSRFGVV